MFRTKLIFVLLLLSLICSAACKSTKRGNAIAPNPEREKKIPFGTSLPERFSADIEISFFNPAQTIARKYFIARNGNQSLEKFGIGSDSEFWILKKDDKVFRLNPSARSYEEIETSVYRGKDDSLSKSLVSRWLNRRSFKTFEMLEEKEGIKKFRVRVENEMDSETFLYVDQQFDFPFLQESYSVDKEKRTLRFKSEFKNINSNPDSGYFEIPNGFEKNG